MDQIWPPEVVADSVMHHIEKWNIDTVITFDMNGMKTYFIAIYFSLPGVSGHPNHIATFLGVKHLARTGTGAAEFYALDSTPLPVKYFSWLAIPFVAQNKLRKRFILNDFPAVWAAMEAHTSQLVWFRRIYLCFTSFAFVNSLVKIK
jgi:N-acetylglucosaminylphosphatidylinositol deacetylase